MMGEALNGRTRGNVRSFWVLLGLSIITLSLYYFYWLYINLKEIREGIFSKTHDTVLRVAQGLFWTKVIIFIATMAASLFLTLPSALADPYDVNVPSELILFIILSFLVNITFFYTFTASVSLGQREAQLASFNIMGIYVFYLISSLIELISSIFILRSDTISTLSSIHSWSSIPSISSFASFSLLGFFSTVGNILWLVSIFLIQRQINRIWLEGFRKNGENIK